MIRIRNRGARLWGRSLALVLAACGQRGAAPAPTALPAPRDAGGDARGEAVAPLSDAAGAAIDRVMRKVEGDRRPGCAVGVGRRGALVFARGYGAADLAGGRPITPDTVFDLGSTSKQFTAAVTLTLVADGTLARDTAVRSIVPELPTRRGRPIAVHDLLHHTSGLPDYVDLLQDAGHEFEERTTTADALAVIAGARPTRAPGVTYEYSNSGYFLLALIAERVSHQPFAELARARLFAPVGMTHTQVSPRATEDVAARGYDRAHGGWAPVSSAWEQVGDGAVRSTVGDLVRWAGQFDAPTALAPALIAAMLVRGRLDDGRELDYAAGLEHGEHDGRATVSHAGSWVGFGAELLRFPDEGLAIACLCNFDDSDPESLALAIADAVHATR